jgi:monoamine oxidase
MNEAEVIIVGAGLAGLYAAKTLAENKVPFILLESNARMGGRILGSNNNKADNKQYDLGPTWIFPHQQKIQQLIHELDLKIFKQYIDGDALFQRSGSTTPERFSGAGAMELLRLQGGTYTLIDALLRPLNQQDLRTGHTIHSMIQQESIWQLTVNTDEGTDLFCAKHIVLALPPRMIAAHLTPENWASQELTHALNTCQTWMSAQAKFIASYDHPFWREQNLSGQAFSQIGPMLEMHDASIEEDSSYALFGFVGWPVSKRHQYSPESMKQRCIEQLVWFYGEEAQNFNDCEIKDWSLDDKVASNLDISEPSQHPSFPLQSFVQEQDVLNLYFAGSEFAKADPGYLEGAVDAVDYSLNRLLSKLTER